MTGLRRRPDLELERRLALDGIRWVAGCDEVGRGALGGPVTVGVAVVDPWSALPPPDDLADSKLLTPRQRQTLVPLVAQWVASWGVGHATAAEIDRWGLTAALRLAGRRALAQMALRADVVVLDGRHDWLTLPPQTGWLDADDDPALEAPPVVTQVGADRVCASVAAASVLAKVRRDAHMVELARRHPHYDWHENKGYGSPRHLEALERVGPCEEHRRSWRLPGVEVSHDTPRTSVPRRSDAGRLGP